MQTSQRKNDGGSSLRTARQRGAHAELLPRLVARRIGQQIDSSMTATSPIRNLRAVAAAADAATNCQHPLFGTSKTSMQFRRNTIRTLRRRS